MLRSVILGLFSIAALAAQTSEIAINCGGSAYVGADGKAWSADQFFSGGDVVYSSDSISNTSDLGLYRPARYGLYGDFSYAIPVANGTYNLSLMFAELQYWNKGDRVFNVLVNGAPVLTNFDILAETASRAALTKTFSVTVSTGVLQIAVQGVVKRGILNAIRIVPSTTGSTTTTTTTTTTAGPTTTASTGAPVASINCGGAAFTGVDGTAWTGDQYYSGGDLLYSGYLVTGTQDLALYRTARRGLYGNFGYTIPVPNGSYLLKLRFAELMFSGKGQRVFNVNVNGAAALSNFDILADVAPLAVDDKQFPVSVTDGKIQIDVIGVVGFGIVNGIQVFPATTGTASPALSVSTNTLAFSATAGGGNPAPQPVTVTTTASWSATSNQSWLTVTPGAGSFAAAANVAGLAAGAYSGAITISAAGATGSPQTVDVSLSIASATLPPGVSASPTTLSFAATAGGGNPSGQAITIANTGGGTLNWTATKTQPWLLLGASSGVGPALISVQAFTGSLPAGTYTDIVTISASGAAPAAQIVIVTLTVAPAQTTTTATSASPLISINCGGAAFTGADGTSWTADQYFTGGDLLYSGYTISGTQDLALYRAARRGLYGDFSYTIPVPVGSYTLKLRFAETMFGSKGQRVFNVNVNRSPVLANFDILNDVPSLTADDKQFPVTVTTGAIEIDVIGVVGRGLLSGIQVFPVGGSPAPAVTPALSVSASTLSFSGNAGGANPAGQTVNVTTTASWTATSNQPWLTVTTAASSVGVSANLNGLAAGNYSGAVTVSAAGANGSPQTVNVTLTVAPAVVPTPGIASFSAASANITAGASTTLSWSTSNATGVSIDQGIGAVGASSSIVVSPAATTTYTLSAGNSAGTVMRTVTVTVTAAQVTQTTPPATTSGNTGNTDQWTATSNPPQSPTGGQVLYNGIQLPQAWPPLNSPSQVSRTAPYILNPPSVIPIDLGRQLFVDDFLIAQTNLARVQHQPVMYVGNPVLAPFAQGQDNNNNAFPFSDGVWYDPADHIFKLWYFGGNGNDICYAYSTDGKNWIKPRVADAAVPNTNMVLQIGGGRDSTTVWMDLRDPNPSRKFKAFVYYTPQTTPIIWIYFSPDGIHWTGPQSNTPLSLSDRTTFFRNPFRNVWVESARQKADLPATPNRAEYFARARYYSESADLLNFSPSDPSTSYWTGPEDRDPAYPGSSRPPDLYTLDATPYESLMVGMFNWYYPSDGPELVEIGVGFSRDGFNWVRPTRGAGPNNAFIASTDLPNTWNGYNTQSAGGGFLVVGDQLYFYFSGRNSPHNLESGSTLRQTGLATLRRDGFYSMDAGAAQGVLTTRPVRFAGSHLFVNVADAAGALQVEVLDSTGNVIPQFARVNSAAIAVDKTMQEVTWSSGAIGSLAGQTVQFRFYLTNGSLYSFWVSNSTSGASNGYVAAGGPGYTSDIDTVGAAAGNTTPSGTVALPVISPAGGVFSGAVTVSIASSTSGATIRYTTDGSTPGTASPLYTGPFAVNASMTIKAIASAAGLADSSVALGLFTVQADTTPPSRGSGAPSGTLAFGTTQTTLSLRTGEPAICKYSTVPNTPFGAMTGSFTTPDGIAQSAAVSGLASGIVYSYYVRCQDATGNANPDDFVIGFAIASSGSFTPMYQYVEAESGTLIAPMAAFGSYVATPVDSAGSLSFTVAVPATGSYYLWGKILSVDAGSDSFYVSVDGGPTDVYDTAENLWSTSWQWTKVNGRGSTGQALALNPRIFTLTAGPHTFTFAGRDPNTKLDQVLVTNDVSFVPVR
jgi:hypothetical protein